MSAGRSGLKASFKCTITGRNLSGVTFRSTYEPHAGAAAYRYPCCRYRTLHERGGDEICPMCFWEDDGQDDYDADDVRGGPNGALSLIQARQNFARYAFPIPLRQHVRAPTEAEH